MTERTGQDWKESADFHSAATASCPGAESDLVILLEEYDELYRLCNSLEALADRLAKTLIGTGHLDILRQLESLLPSTHRHALLFLDGLLAAHPLIPDISGLMERIDTQHHEDEGLLDELVDAFRPNLISVLTPNTRGYMLRCFFSGVRRAILFEEHIIFSYGHDRLSSGALGRLSDRLSVGRPRGLTYGAVSHVLQARTKLRRSEP